MTTQSDDPQRPPDSPALRRAEQALRALADLADEDPAQQLPALTEAQQALADLLAEQPAADPSAAAPTQQSPPTSPQA